MVLAGGGSPINTAISGVSTGRIITPHVAGSDIGRYGSGGDNINATTLSRVGLNPLTNQDVYDAAGSVAKTASLARLLTPLHGLSESQSLPPSGVGGVGGAGGAAKSEGAGGGAGPQKTTSTNPNNGGLSPAQVSALNQQNKLPPELLAQMLADKTNKTNSRRDPELKKQGEATADPKLNEVLKELGKGLSKQIDEYDKKIKESLKDLTETQFKDKFGESGFNKKDELHDFLKGMKAEVEKGHFNQETSDKHEKFLDAVEKDGGYPDILKQGQEIQDAYQKGLDNTKNDRVAGNFITAADEVTKGDENKDGKSYLDSFLDQAGESVVRNEDGTPKLDEEGKPEFQGENAESMSRFYDLAQNNVDKAREMMQDSSTGKADTEKFLQEGEFNESITEMKGLYNEFKANMQVADGDKNYAEETMNNMMFMKASSPLSPGAEKMEAGLDELSEQNKGEPITRDQVLENPKLQDHFEKYYSEAFSELPEPDNKYKHPSTAEDEDSAIQNNPNTAVAMNSTRSAEEAASDFTDSVGFAEDDFDLQDEEIALNDDFDL